MCASPAGFLVSFDAAKAAPLSAGEFRTADDTGELLDRVPLPDLLAFHEHGQERLDLAQPFFKRHGSSPSAAAG
jgi:hypothetical protein